MDSTPKDHEPELEGSEHAEEYKSPEVEEATTEAGPAVTAAGDSPQDVAISLVEDDE